MEGEREGGEGREGGRGGEGGREGEREEGKRRGFSLKLHYDLHACIFDM